MGRMQNSSAHAEVWDYLWEKYYCACGRSEGLQASFFKKHHFYLKDPLTHKLVVQTWVLNIFSKMNRVNLSLDEKSLTMFIAKDTIWTFKWKLWFLKTYFCHHGFNCFPVLKSLLYLLLNSLWAVWIIKFLFFIHIYLFSYSLLIFGRQLCLTLYQPMPQFTNFGIVFAFFKYCVVSKSSVIPGVLPHHGAHVDCPIPLPENPHYKGSEWLRPNT